MTQIHDLETYELISLKTTPYEDRKKALTSLLFITKKINGEIKGRKIMGGNKQRLYDG